MGNCCKPASSMEWDGDDWSDLRSSKVFDQEAHVFSLPKVQKEKLIRASSDANGKVIKIKILKKELEELLEKQQEMNKKQVGRAIAEQVLLRLIKSSHHHSGHRICWKPMLDSIPEVN